MDKMDTNKQASATYYGIMTLLSIMSTLSEGH